MKKKNVDAARELRLWIRDVIIPMASVVGVCAFYGCSNAENNDKFEAFTEKLLGHFRF